MKTFAYSAAMLLALAPAFGEMAAPATVEFDFAAVDASGISTTRKGDTAYLRSVHRSGGTIANRWWHIAPAAPFGEGTLRFDLDRAELAGDLALVLRTDWKEDTNIAVQLLDSRGRAIALDLFGEMAHNARAVGTDTFVIPLSRYPEATTIAVRRLSGDLRVLGGGLYPVLTEVTASAETEKALAEQLGMMLSPHHWSFSQGGGATKEVQGAPPTEHVGQVHSVPALAQANQTGAVVLNQPGYPTYTPLTGGELQPVRISTASTASPIVENAVRLIALRAGSKPPEPHHTSSDRAAVDLLSGDYTIVFMSVPLSSAQKEEFFRKHGYPVVELRFARDAIEVLVNGSNPLRELTIPQLDAIFGSERKAGASKPLENWDELGWKTGAIAPIRGALDWGTTRTFQKLVLKDGPFRAGLAEAHVVFSNGMEKAVAEKENAIGFASFRPRKRNVRGLAIAENSGETAYPPNVDTIYSGKYPLQRMFYSYLAARSLKTASAYEREFVNLLLSDVGQTLVARSGNLPLMASEVAAERTKLALPQGAD